MARVYSLVASRQLQQAWLFTWAPTNGILMMGYIHELVDVQLFSIHLETLRI